MTAMQLLESMEFLDDALLEERETPAASPKRRLAWIPAACLVIAVLAIALTAKPRTPAADAPHLDAPPPGKVQSVGGETRPIQPVGVPGPAAQTASPAPAVLAWIDVDASAAQAVDWALKQGVMMVGEKLTAAQCRECMPEILLEWMANAEGAATYLLHDGSGGLVNVELRVTNPEWGGTTTIRIRDKDAWQVPVCDVGLDEDAPAAVLNGQEYRAYRYDYFFGEGDPDETPPQPWVELTVQFEKEHLEYTMLSSVPASEEDAAAADLRDLLLAYAGTHTVPDLNSYQCGAYVHRDERLSFSDARGDADYGAYLPQAEPEGLDDAELRRYQLGAVGEALTDDWLLAQWYQITDTERRSLIWRVTPVMEEAKQRLVSPGERERYDFGLYPATNWYYAVAPENRLTMEDPVFRAEDLTMELVGARAHEDYDGAALLRFSVLYDSGVLVSIDARGISPDWVFAQLSGIQP